MVAELLFEWAHGTLKGLTLFCAMCLMRAAKSTAVRKSQRKQSKTRDLFQIMPKTAVTPFDGLTCCSLWANFTLLSGLLYNELPHKRPP